MQKSDVIIIGGGVSGLMCAIELLKNGKSVLVLEKESEVGGQCRTREFSVGSKSYRFDYGGHRFITHNKELLNFVEQILDSSLLVSQRSSVILHKGKVYDYPLNIKNLLKVAPFGMLFGSIIDSIKILLNPKKDNSSFESWIVSRFGKTLYKNFFAPYTQKLWGIEPTRLSSHWAGQRISLLDIKDVLKKLLFRSKKTVRTYAKSYRYPKNGFGELPFMMAQKVRELGGEIVLGANVDSILYHNNSISGVCANAKTYKASHIISTMPLNEMSRLLGYESGLGFRSLKFLCLALDMEDFSSYTWQYVSDAEFLATRIQEPKRRSVFMSPEAKSSIMLEIPCNKDDEIWKMDKDELLKIALQDLKKLGFDIKDKIIDSFLFDSEHAYTIMDIGYDKKRDKTIEYLNRFENLIMCGRQGSFRYIFLDSAMEMGLMASKIVLGDTTITKDMIYNHSNEKVVIETRSIA